MSRWTAKTTDQARDRFLAALAQGATVSEACEAASLGRSTAYNLRQRDEQFAVAWADALEDGTQIMEAEARRRAVDGWEEPVYQGGQMVGTIRKFDSSLLMFILKARRPEVYRERMSVDQTTRFEGPSAERTRAMRAAAERDPEAFERASRALAEGYAHSEEGPS